ncbi:MAG: Cache 3/Cache 2 fusion domain-containing protein [Thermodesulfobacteriota bacterium]
MIKDSLKHCAKPMVMLFVLVLVMGGAFTALAETEHSAKIKEAMTVMKDQAAKLGEPKADGTSLFFGTTKMNGNYEIVDSLKAQFGCTATFFVKKGDGFIRISTNVLKDGNRAVGTPLDPNGPAIAAIRKGEVFYGVVDILGSQYDTGYEPINNAAGEIQGVYYIGYPLAK